MRFSKLDRNITIIVVGCVVSGLSVQLPIPTFWRAIILIGLVLLLVFGFKTNKKSKEE